MSKDQHVYNEKIKAQNKDKNETVNNSSVLL